MHRLISTSFVLKHADGRAFALTSIRPIVAHKSVRLLNDWHELLAYSAVDLCTVLWIKVIVTNNGEHDASPYLEFSISLSSAKVCIVHLPDVGVNANHPFNLDKCT